MRVVTLRLSSRIKLALALWCVGELLAFAVVAKVIGVAGAIFLGLAISLVGFWLLKRAGAAAILKLRATVEGRGPKLSEDRAGEVLDDTLAAAGALALVLPGFLSDIVGLTLVLPALRGQLARWIGRGGFSKLRRGGRRSERGPATIDLDPEEWRRTDPASRPISKV